MQIDVLRLDTQWLHFDLKEQASIIMIVNSQILIKFWLVYAH